MSGVDGEAEGGVARLLRPADDVLCPVPISVHVQLKDFWALRTPGDLLQGWFRNRADDVYRPELRRGFRCGGACLGSEDLKRAYWSEHHRDAHPMAEERGGGIGTGDVDQDARAKGQAVEGQPVAPHRRFGLRPAAQVVPRALGEVATSRLDDLFVGHKIRGH